MRRDGDCQLTAFMLLTRYFLASDTVQGRVCCVCVVAESAFFAPQRKSHTHRLTSAHFLSIECCEGKHQNRFVFCLHNDFT